MSMMSAMLTWRRKRAPWCLVATVCAVLLIYHNTLDMSKGGRNRQQSQIKSIMEDTVNADTEGEARKTPYGLRVKQYPWPNGSQDALGQLILTAHMKGGRLGNDMFRYASLRGIAARNAMRPVLFKPEVKVRDLARVFRLRSSVIALDDSDITQRSYTRYVESIGCGYDEGTEELVWLDQDIIIEPSILQSYKYFTHIEDEIRSEFTFNGLILNKARVIFNRITSENPMGTIYVGIHVRRGDMAKPKYIKKGYSLPSAGYFRSAIGYFRSRFRQPLLFIICTDDAAWSRRNLPLGSGDLVLAPSDSPAEVDLALLTLCDHTIMSVGSFGWWAGWLAGGTTVYFNGYPRKDSRIGRKFRPQDYYPPEWIGLP